MKDEKATLEERLRHDAFFSAVARLFLINSNFLVSSVYPGCSSAWLASRIKDDIELVFGYLERANDMAYDRLEDDDGDDET